MHRPRPKLRHAAPCGHVATVSRRRVQLVLATGPGGRTILVQRVNPPIVLPVSLREARHLRHHRVHLAAPCNAMAAFVAATTQHGRAAEPHRNRHPRPKVARVVAPAPDSSTLLEF